MCGYFASSAGVTCAALLTLTLPLALPAVGAVGAVAAGPDVRGPAAPAGGRSAPIAEPAVPGSTQSLPLVPLTHPRADGAAPEQGLTPQAVHSFSLVGVVWDDPGAELRGSVQVRTRASGTARWSPWQELETHNLGHGPDRDSAEGRSSRVRGSTAPLWVGDSDAIEVRVRAEDDRTGTTRAPLLPEGLRVELVDPGKDAPTGAPAQTTGTPASAGSPGEGARDTGPDPQPATSAADPEPAPSANPQPATSAADAEPALSDAPEVPALSAAATEEALLESGGSVQPYIGPRPRIVTRSGWGADESLREPGFVYTTKVKVAFVHHTASGNNYTCAQAPSVVRGIYRYHVVSNGWRDIGYNFLVDKCGNIYEGRAGGVDKPVMGAHTMGFNTDSMGVAVIGTYTGTEPPAAAVNAVAGLSAWKLGLYGMDPRGTTYLESGGGNLYPKGQNVRLNVISGHRDGFATECPGKLLYAKLGTVRSSAARLQGR